MIISNTIFFTTESFQFDRMYVSFLPELLHKYVLSIRFIIEDMLTPTEAKVISSANQILVSFVHVAGFILVRAILLIWGM